MAWRNPRRLTSRSVFMGIHVLFASSIGRLLDCGSIYPTGTNYALWYVVMRTGIRFLITVATMHLFLMGCISVYNASLFGEDLAADALVNRRLLADTIQVPSEPIRIAGDGDFEELGLPGSGTRDSPYRIENLLILSNQTCIDVRDTRSWFEIANCTLTSNTHGKSGVRLTNVSHATITECHVTNMLDGVYLLHSSNCTVLDCSLVGILERGVRMEIDANITISGNEIHDGGGDGIFITGRNRGSVVSNNIVHNNEWHGIFLQAARDIQVFSNVVTDSLFGILLERSENIFFRDNELRGHSLGGLLFETSGHNVVTDNRFYGCGLQVHGYPIEDWALEVFNNTVGERPLGFLQNITDAILDASEYGQIVLVGSRNVVLQNAVIHDTDHGVRVGYCENVTVTASEILDCSRDGIVSQYSSNCTFSYNLLHGTSRAGIYLFQCSRCSVRENTIYGNLDGVSLSDTDNSTISGNEIVFNERYGIRFGFGSDSNLVFDNRLGWNNLSNGYDDSENNRWDTGVIGNAWSDYAGGECYWIPGPSSSVDRFPRSYTTDTTQTTSREGFENLILIASATIVVSLVAVIVLFVSKKRHS
ncbi:hypothetical protein EU546_03540 [Candidatus Thorarchaeota archaeon]|nr:MAG: hypothetical protein EU546_03540 [Candidatus Thorarchaeota archaeon]